MDAVAIADDMVAAVMAVFCINLIPMLLNRMTRVPWYSSLITGCGLLIMGIEFGIIGLWLSSIMSFIQATLWFGLLVFRRA